MIGPGSGKKITGNIKFQADSIFTRFSQNYNILQESSRSRRPFAWTGNRNTDLYRRAKIKTDLYRRANLKQLKENFLMPWRQTMGWLFFLMTLFLELEMHWFCHLKFLSGIKLACFVVFFLSNAHIVTGGRTKCQPDKMPTEQNANQRLAFCPSQFLVGILSGTSQHVLALCPNHEKCCHALSIKSVDTMGPSGGFDEFWW